VQITKQAVCDSVRESLILFVSLLSVNHSMQRPAVVGAAGKLEGGAAAGRRAVQRPTAGGLCSGRREGCAAVGELGTKRVPEEDGAGTHRIRRNHLRTATRHTTREHPSI